MEFGVLGPLRVVSASGLVEVPGPRQRALLARLLLQAGSTVSVDQLVESVWGGDASADSRAALPSYVLRLRRALGSEVGARVVTRPGGYAIELDRDELDLHRFQDLRTHAGVLAASGDRRSAYELLEKALALWRGEPLEDVQALGVLRAEGEELAAARVQAWIDFFEEGLRLGRHAVQLPEITAIAKQFPFDERLQAQWILALYRCGRQKDALGTYQEVRRRLVEELGIEPTPRLANLHQQILVADPRLLETTEPDTARPPAAHSTRARSTVAHAPRQLPATPRHFTGRSREMDELRKLLVEGASAQGQAILALLSGTAGVGKTALAIRFAHEVADRFPDGQLYIDLQGYDAAFEPMDAPSAVRRLLSSLTEGGSANIPADPDAQLAAYRRRLADTRTLIVLDNARKPEQIRPLIPGSSQSLVLITSRDQLPGLIALDGALPMAVDLLPYSDAWELVTCRLGERVAGNEALVREMIDICSRLPLALNIATALVAGRPNTSIVELVAQLQGGSKPLDALSVGEAAGDVRAVISWSYKALDGPSAKMFRLLGLHPGPDISAPAAASLAGIDPKQAARTLRRLVDASLLTESGGGARYTMHDLLRAYAVELSDLHSTPDARSRALQRVLDHYLHSGHAAAPPSYARWLGLDLQKPAPGVTHEQFPEAEQATAWRIAERAVLVATTLKAAAEGFDDHVWQLAGLMMLNLRNAGLWQEWESLTEAALNSARSVGSTFALAHAYRWTGEVHRTYGRYPEALDCFSDALQRFEELDDQRRQGMTVLDIGQVAELRGDFVDSLALSERALRLFRAAGDTGGQSQALNNLSVYSLELGQYEKAAGYCNQAIEMARDQGSHSLEFALLDTLGQIQHRAGDTAAAIATYGLAIEKGEAKGLRFNLPDVLDHLGDCLADAGQIVGARDAWGRALSILDDFQRSSMSEAISAKMQKLGVQDADV